MSFFDIQRKLILSSLFLYTVYFFSPYVYEKIYDPNILNILFSSPLESVISLSQVHSWLLLIVHVIGAVLLFFRVLYSKYIYVVIILIDILLSLLSGITTYTGFDILVLALMNMIDGTIIYLLFFNRH